ncbi:ribbon-helix-helix domain-containing protein [Bradyrhizobium sp. 76]|uniref:ribbon-helix-helix domain-containing protein n=1 Tax=Bradyrhizobium sp. 76 TaxID=2782680 RepID=UPI001FFC16F7|nr:ribbon-helix-helix domain-containing protein [Bradyrhizobium sp. 76]MCK1407138.1 ribbon-helix-helix domain-containing protein [Bradyrhizobium sp. 76]
MSQVTKRSIAIRNHKTSVSLEDEFWTSLHQIALTEGTNLKGLITEIDSQRAHANLSCAIRLYVLDHYRLRARMAAHSAMAPTSGYSHEADHRLIAFPEK